MISPSTRGEAQGVRPAYPSRRPLHKFLRAGFWGKGFFVGLDLRKTRGRGKTAKRWQKVSKRAWKQRIKQACVDAETYKPYFDYVIDELAGILDRRDKTEAEYEKDGRPVIEFTNKGGATNTIKNPLLVLIEDMNRSALSYWRDLGLTPAGLRKINEKTFKTDDKTSNSLIDRLKELQEARQKHGGTEGN